MRWWHPVMRRPVMATNIMSSPETWNIQPHVTTEVRVKVTIPTLRKSSGHSSMSPVLSRRNHACSIAFDQFRSSIRLYKPGTKLFNRGETITCAITRHDNTTPHAATVANTKNFGQRPGNYNSLLRFRSSSTNYESSRFTTLMNLWIRWLK